MYPEGRVKKFGGYDKAIRIQFEAEYLASIVWEGAKKRWGENLDDETRERVQFELDTVRTMGFPGYFLIVHDYIDSARKMGVWVGPGRGSAAGSAVAYALGITNVDPLKFDLLFERFLNPDRISMPDIDVDFDDAGRERVIEYVTKKYGADHVAHIVTFGQMAAKSAIKDVGRVMGYPLADTVKIANYVPDTPKITLSKARKESPDLEAAFTSEDETVHKLMERAERLEGSIRQPGVHACGIIISRDPLIETLPVMPTPEKGGKSKDQSEDAKDKLLTTQYDGHFVEPVGLLKMDFLGLKTLTVEKECTALLKERGIDLNPDEIPDDDKETYELFGRGETTGLFQFESPGMKKWLKALQPEKLTDLVAMNALYRPGPMDYIPSFVARKQGTEEITYDHPLMEKHLKDTYGVTVYQEQVMLLSRLLAGFSRGDSDKLRKAMGKKLMDIMNELKAKFIDGCLKNPEFRIGKWADETEARNLIEKIWRDWEAFASYAFNKSHAVCYAWVAYQTGYMKAHYPAEFMCAQISSEIGNFDKLPGFVNEAKEMGLKLLLPDVNESGARFVPTADSKGIRYGLGGIKGVGAAAAEAIVTERRENGPYKGVLDFCMRLAHLSVVNKRVLENLSRVGAFSTIEPNRAKVFNNIEFVIKRSQQRAKEKASAQTDFFGLMAGGEETYDDSELVDSPPFSPAEELKYERDLMGVYISGDPLESCKRLISELSVVKVDAPDAPVMPFSFAMIERDKNDKTEGEDEGSSQEIPVSDDMDESVPPSASMNDSESDIYSLLEKSDEKDWPLKSMARNIVRAKGEVSWSDKQAFDKAVNKEKAKLKKKVDKSLLKKLDIRAVGILKGCFVKTPKPRPDGQVGAKWAILAVDDGRGLGEGAAFAKVWESCSSLETRVDQLVMVSGELSYKVTYQKEDVQKLNPQKGDLSFTIKEAYPLEDAMPMVSEALRIRINHGDPDLEKKVRAIHDAAAENPGRLPTIIELKYENGDIVDVDLGPTCRVAVTLGFLSRLSKVVQQSDTSFVPSGQIYFKQREPKPWEV
jgi:DNA-directed DNA polymerase III PolC